jgi:DivIVA domain-containing protein
VTSGQNQTGTQQGHPERRLSPADLQHVRFTRASMMRPGYVEGEVDRVVHRVAEELGRLIAEKAELRDQVRALQAQLDGTEAQAPPSEQAVRILASAQLTADNYVAEAEEFSRQVTAEARTQYEEATREARETAGAIIQAAQEAAAKLGTAGAGIDPRGADPRGTDPRGADQRSVEELQEQAAYLKAFGQACRVQLRSYLEALLADVEREWGRAEPTALPAAPARPPAQRSSRSTPPAATFESNRAADNGGAGSGQPDRADADVPNDVVQVVAVRE